jgi:hypothetical protein
MLFSANPRATNAINAFIRILHQQLRHQVVIHARPFEQWIATFLGVAPESTTRKVIVSGKKCPKKAVP